MFNVVIKDYIIKHCKNLLKETNFGKRGIADGNVAEQFIGIVGQCVVMDLLNIPLLKTSETHDGGIDFIHNNKTYDVKTMGRNCDPKDYYVNNLIGLQDKYNVDRYIFCSVNKKNITVTLCGWIDKKDFLNKANFYPIGTIRHRSDNTSFATKADLYELENNKLNHINNMEDLIKLV